MVANNFQNGNPTTASLSPADYRERRIDAEGALPAAATNWPSLIERDRWVDLAADTHKLTANQTSVLRRVCFRAGSERGCTESQGNMGKWLRVDRRTVQRCLDRLLDLGLLEQDGRKHESATGNAYIPNFLLAEKLGCDTLGGQPKSEGITLETDTGIELGCDNEDIRLRHSLTHKQKEQRLLTKLTNYINKPGDELGPTTLQEREGEKKIEPATLSVTVAPLSQPNPAQVHPDIPECRRCAGPLMTPERRLKTKLMRMPIDLTMPCKDCAVTEIAALEATGALL